MPTFVPGEIGTNALYYSTTPATRTTRPTTMPPLGTPADLAFGANMDFTWLTRYRCPSSAIPAGKAGCRPSGMWPVVIGTAYRRPATPSGRWAVCGRTWLWTLAPDVGFAYGSGYPNVTITDGNWRRLVHSFDRTGNRVAYYDGVRVARWISAASATWIPAHP